MLSIKDLKSRYRVEETLNHRVPYIIFTGNGERFSVVRQVKGNGNPDPDAPMFITSGKTGKPVSVKGVGEWVKEWPNPEPKPMTGYVKPPPSGKAGEEAKKNALLCFGLGLVFPRVPLKWCNETYGVPIYGGDKKGPAMNDTKGRKRRNLAPNELREILHWAVSVHNQRKSSSASSIPLASLYPIIKEHADVSKTYRRKDFANDLLTLERSGNFTTANGARLTLMRPQRNVGARQLLQPTPNTKAGDKTPEKPKPYYAIAFSKPFGIAAPRLQGQSHKPRPVAKHAPKAMMRKPACPKSMPATGGSEKLSQASLDKVR